MGSPTKQKKLVLKRKHRNGGKVRKKAIAKGTTPRFPVHVEDAPDCVLPQPPRSQPK
jgi:hypothetical protein